MSEVRPYLWLIPALPLFAAAFIAFFGPKLLRRQSHWPCVLVVAASCVLSVMAFMAVRAVPAGGEFPPVTYYPWIEAGNFHADYALRADPLSTMMLVMITFVGTLIMIFAVGYMDGDAGYARFFATMSLFVFAMTTLVLANNFMMLFLGWEGVGLCSYLLIGHWFKKPEAAAAARKAFLVTRLGDVGMLIGLYVIWGGFMVKGPDGQPVHLYSFDYPAVFAAAGEQSNGMLLAACLLLFCGAAGKSAQFPLHVWLPDAMEGPTPVSALIHAATMVTAGVYLVARCTPLFVLAPDAQLVVGVIGAFTALMAALIALTQNDLKRVLAYSTLSQLGYMFLALGCGIRGGGLVTFAVVAALFHLFTHAFFKALLFLSAGSVMHAMGNVIDMRRFSGLRKVMPLTHIAFLCGALALAGLPFLSGFWSKDEILAAASLAGHHNAAYTVLLYVGVVTAALTAFYTFRAYFRTFWGELVVPPEAGMHGHGDDAEEHGHGHGHVEARAAGHGGQAHESPPVMTLPLMVLAVFALGVGGAIGPTHIFAQFVERTPGFPEMVEHEANVPLMVSSGVIALVGIALAWLMYVRRPDLPGKLATSMQGAYQLSLNKFHFDELYGAFILGPLAVLTQLVRAFDYYLLDGLVDLVGQVPRMIGYLFRPVQNGLVQFYALAMILGLTVFLLALIRAL
jgi:NADH-quinone oxidoreductase subunit L